MTHRRRRRPPPPRRSAARVAPAPPQEASRASARPSTPRDDPAPRARPSAAEPAVDGRRPRRGARRRASAAGWSPTGSPPIRRRSPSVSKELEAGPGAAEGLDRTGPRCRSPRCCPGSPARRPGRRTPAWPRPCRSRSCRPTMPALVPSRAGQGRRRRAAAAREGARRRARGARVPRRAQRRVGARRLRDPDHARRADARLLGPQRRCRRRPTWCLNGLDRSRSRARSRSSRRRTPRTGCARRRC